MALKFKSNPVQLRQLGLWDYGKQKPIVGGFTLPFLAMFRQQAMQKAGATRWTPEMGVGPQLHGTPPPPTTSSGSPFVPGQPSNGLAGLPPGSGMLAPITPLGSSTSSVANALMQQGQR